MRSQKKQKASWAPTGEALKNILQQKKFADLNGNTEAHGAHRRSQTQLPTHTLLNFPLRVQDLKTVVLHKLTMSSQKSTFPVALGIRATGVDDATFSITGEAYSAIAMPDSVTHVGKTLQEASEAPLPSLTSCSTGG